MGDKIALTKYDYEVKVLKKAKESFIEKERYYDFSLPGRSTQTGERNSLFKPELILDRIFNYLGVKSKEFEKFKELENKIMHFRRIQFRDGDKYNEVKRKIEEVRKTLIL